MYRRQHNRDRHCSRWRMEFKQRKSHCRLCDWRGYGCKFRHRDHYIQPYQYCETAIATKTLTVDTIAMPGIITGPNVVCPGTTITLIDTVAGGVWNSANIAIATVETDTGIVTGVSAGNVLISYAVTSYCGISYASKSVAVPALPDAIGKNVKICIGTTKVLGDNLGGR